MDKVLKELKKLKDVYYETETSEFGKDLKVTMKLLNSQEETESHSYSAKFEQGLSYLYSVKRETLARAIIELNGNKIPDIIEDKDNGGKVQRHIWLRENVIQGWSQVLIDEMWHSYAKLITKLEKNIGVTVTTEEDEKSKE